MTGRLIFVGFVLCLVLVEAQIRSSFSCEGRVSGYYADVGTGCQVYHMCDGLGRRFSFTCPNATLFQQRMLICDHWFMVNCSRSESQYNTNLLIGQKETPFVGESGLSSFQRTPRPDYTAIDLDKTENVFQRPPEDSNAIPANSEEQNRVPSSWSTEYSVQDAKTQFSRRQDQQLVNRLGNNQQVNYQSNFKATTPVYPKVVDEALKLNDLALVPPKNQPPGVRIEDINNLQSTEYAQEEDTSVPVNFESKFKATTPVYPTFVDESLKLSNLELSPPILQSQSDNVVIEDKTGGSPVVVNFESKFKATTPVYPTFVDETLKLNNLELSPPALQAQSDNAVVNNRTGESPVVVNFESKFKATTPVYPPFVDESLKLDNLELSAPSSVVGEEEIAKVNFVSNFKATTPVYPLSVEATSPIPDGVGLLPPLEDLRNQYKELEQATTRRSVNFESNFAATIPNYPTSVESTSPLPDEVGLLPPGKNNLSGRYLSFQPPNEANYQDQNQEEEPNQPSTYYEPPLFETGYVDPNGALASYKTNSDHVLAPKIDDWNALRRRLAVPDFDFPLDSEVKRASYESDRSSFQPRPSGSQVR
ncbi:uncharacterized protein LOC123676624 [Harmonia axyridis]|uniref:uncharacterized protein LOC123676624 n=1 Tax=Harmonia axyridis TaxID=115357 RepID=UPI001E276681|nr:uncharacterized protein LOC123676624 [Harmonia axyridis]